jgi:hypothetical protein
MGKSRDPDVRSGSAVKLVVAGVLLGAVFGASKASLPRRAATRAISVGRAWSKRQLDRSLQAPVIKSQGERWRAMHPGA